MKRFAALSLSALTALAFTTATLAPSFAEAKSHSHKVSKKKKKKKKSSDIHASAKTPTERAPASTAERSSAGYQRAALYMAKHDDGSDAVSKKKKSRKKS